MENEKYEERLLGLDDLMQIVPIGRTKIYKMMQQNEIPSPFKIGRKLFWKNSEIMEWIKRQSKNRVLM